MSAALYLQNHPAACIAVATLVGLMVGSFLNVVVHRLPLVLEREWLGEVAEVSGDTEAASHYAAQTFGLVTPRSQCPSCRTLITAWRNIPVLSYLALRGRCATCAWRIPARYPLIELLCAFASGLVAWRFGYGAAMVGALLVTWALIALSAIDIDTQLLPDAITLPFLWLGLMFNLFAIYTPLRASVIGAVGGYLILWGVFHAFRLLTGKEGMGYGDFKLLAMLGAWQGWQSLPVIVLLSSAVGALVGVALMVLGRHQRDAPMPFGPYLAAAGWLSLMWGESMTQAYLGVTG